MEFITREVMEAVLKETGEELDSILEKEGEKALAGGENYCSNIVRAKVKVKLSSGKILDKVLILKAFLEEVDPTAHNELKLFFANEGTMYLKILNNLARLGKEHKLEGARMWPLCYRADTDVVIFEDLKEDGYRVIPRQNGLSLEDGIQAIRHLARLHALSIVAQKRGYIDCSLVRPVYTWVQKGDTWIQKYLRNTMNIAGDLAIEWGKEWEAAGKRIKELTSTIIQTLSDLYQDKGKIVVVNHGDCWMNNMLFKYKSDGKTLESIRFVDFQNANVNSYGWDLVYFLYSSLLGNIMRPNYDTLLEAYRVEFVNTLQTLGEDSKLAPTLDEIKAEIVRLHPFCLAIACSLSCVVFSTAKHDMHADDLVHNEKKVRSMFINQNFETTMKANIKYFIEHKVL